MKKVNPSGKKKNTESECICTKNMDSKTLEAQMEALKGERIKYPSELDYSFCLGRANKPSNSRDNII